MFKFIISGLIAGLLFASEYNYQQAVQYATNTAESDMEIVSAMNEYGFELESPFDDITEQDKLEALIKISK